MKAKLSAALLLVAANAFCQSNVFTEFYVHHGGTNVNAGSTTNAAAVFTFTSGDWSTVTSGFTAAAADLSGLSTQMFASVYIDGATNAVFVGRVTNLDNVGKIIYVSQQIKSGTAPVTGTGTRTIKVGGAWYGPWGAQSFPFGFVQTTMTNTSAYIPRINFLGDAPYVNTNATTCGNVGPIVWSGYTNAPGDGGKFLYMQTNAVAGIDVFNISQANQIFSDMIISNASSSSSYNFDVNAATTLNRCTSLGANNNGIYLESGAAGSKLIECEVRNCAKSSGHGFYCLGTGCTFLRCLSVSNNFTTAGVNGFHIIGDYNHFINCIAAKNGGDGFFESSAMVKFISCDSYSNAANGLRIVMSSGTANVFVQNSNFAYNKGAGITNEADRQISGLFLNNGFGQGVATNLLGNVMGTRTGLIELGTVNYASGSTPWNDPNNMDFRIVLGQARGTGSGRFNDTINVSYPDIGAVQGNANVTPIEIQAVFSQ